MWGSGACGCGADVEAAPFGQVERRPGPAPAPQVVTDQDNVWALYTVTGTHSGPIRGIEPTGRRVRYPIVSMYRVDGGLITEADFVSDDLRMMRQLGVLPY